MELIDAETSRFAQNLLRVAEMLARNDGDTRIVTATDVEAARLLLWRQKPKKAAILDACLPVGTLLVGGCGAWLLSLGRVGFTNVSEVTILVSLVAVGALLLGIGIRGKVTQR